jgi:hypothetical protein
MRWWVWAVLTLLISVPAWSATYCVSQMSPQASDEGPGSAERPWKTMGKAAEMLLPGDRAIVHAGVYREYVEPRNSGLPGAPIVYEAAPGEEVVATGADVATGWRRVEGPRPIFEIAWRHDFIIDTIAGRPVRHHPNDEEHQRSGRAEQMIVDGEVWDYPQIQLSLADMKPGTFFPDPENGRLCLWLKDGSNPDAHRIEASTREMIFGSNPWARPKGFQYVWVRGFTFRYAATFPQRPAVWLLGKGNRLEDCVVEWMAGGGALVGPEDGVMRGCTVRRCGHVGDGAYGRNFLNEGDVWEENTRKPINRMWEAGGVKLTASHGGAFQRCVFRNNGGPGLWFDVDVANVVVRDCLFENNECSGMSVEISRDIYVLNNLFVRNGLRFPGIWAEAGLTLAESRNCVVAKNLLVGNRDGLSLHEQGPRYLSEPGLDPGPFLNSGHVIVGNVSARNAQYQLALWYDTPFFGRHPADMEAFKSESAFEESVRAKEPARWFDPLKQGMLIDGNLYWAGPGEKGFLYGVPWRVRHKEWGGADLAGFSAATGFETHGIWADPGIEESGSGLPQLSAAGAARKAHAGPEEAVPEVR